NNREVAQLVERAEDRRRSGSHRFRCVARVLDGELSVDADRGRETPGWPKANDRHRTHAHDGRRWRAGVLGRRQFRRRVSEARRPNDESVERRSRGDARGVGRSVAVTADGVGSPDRILAWGAGAIGGTVAAYLRRAGLEVTVVDANAAHVQAISERGLAITGPIETFTQPLPVFTQHKLAGVWNTIFLCVKALHTEAAARQLAQHLAEDGVVVSLQNGFNELTIAEAIGRRRTMGAFINFGADVLEPGVVHFGGRGAVVVGELDGRQTERLARVHRALMHFEPGAITTDNIWGYLWGKMGYGALLFAGALTPASIVEVLGSRDARPTLTALAREVMAVAAAEGVTPMGFNGYDPAAFGPQGTGAAIDASFDAM